MEVRAEQEKIRLIRAGIIDDIPKGEGRCFEIMGRRLAIFHLEDGSFRAIDQSCPHRGGPLSDGLVGKGSVICPLHGWRIDLETGAVVGEQGRVQAYPVRIHQDEILLEIQG